VTPGALDSNSVWYGQINKFVLLNTKGSMRNKVVPLALVSLLTASALCIAQTEATSKSKTKPPGAGHSDRMLVDNSRAVWEAYMS